MYSKQNEKTTTTTTTTSVICGQSNGKLAHAQALERAA